MNFSIFNALLLLIQILLVVSGDNIDPREDDESRNSRENTPTIDRFKSSANNNEEIVTQSNDALPEENQQVVEATPSIVNGGNIPAKDDEMTKIPMTCINNYAEYCQSKFEGFRFKDGCHRCRCTQRSTDFCEKGVCRFYAHSFEHAVTYCNDVNIENEKNYKIQIHDRKMRIKKEKIVKQKLNSTTTTDKTKINQSNFSPSSTPKLVSGQTIESQSGPGNYDSEQNESRPIIENKTDGLYKTEKRNKNNQTVMRPNKNNDISSSIQRNNETKKRSLNMANKKISKAIEGKIHPVKSSSEDVSDKELLQTIIYYIGLNELWVQEIIKKMEKNPSEDKETELFAKRLKAIQANNTIYKSKILEIVKTKLKLDKSNYGPFNHRFDKVFFKKIVKKLSELNDELHEMKGGFKMWERLSKKLSNAKAITVQIGGAWSLQISIPMVFVAVITTFFVENFKS